MDLDNYSHAFHEGIPKEKLFDNLLYSKMEKKKFCTCIKTKVIAQIPKELGKCVFTMNVVFTL